MSKIFWRTDVKWPDECMECGIKTEYEYPRPPEELPLIDLCPTCKMWFMRRLKKKMSKVDKASFMKWSDKCYKN